MRLELVRRDVAAAVPLADVDHADRQRHPVADAVGHAPAAAVAGHEVDPDELGRAAADVEEDGAGGRRIDQRGAAGDGEACLGLARDDLELEPGLGAHALDELGAVLGRAAGLGGDQAGAARPAARRACRRKS